MRSDIQGWKLLRIIGHHILVTLSLLFAASSVAIAQGNRACLYERPNYGGQVVCVDAGDNIDDLQRLTAWGDRIGSVRLIGFARATIYEETAFGGRSYVIESDLPNLSQLRANELRGWRRVASSIRVQGRGGSGQGQSGDTRACIYAQPNFGGQTRCFNIGDDSSDFRRSWGGNSRVGSIRLFGFVQMTIYEQSAFGGASYTIVNDIPDFSRLRSNELRNWRSEISSFRVDQRRGGGGRPDRPDRDDRVCLYDQPNYAGQSLCIQVGESSSELRLNSGGWNDRAVSIRVLGDAQATIYENVAFGGASYVVSSDIPNLSQVRLGNRGNFRQQVSSISVERRSNVPSYSDAFRLGQTDYQQGRQQNYRTYSGQYDRFNEREFEREYNRGYEEARSNRRGDSSPSEAFRSLNGAYTGVGQWTIGNRSQQFSDLLVRLRSGGNARFEVVNNGVRSVLAGRWTEGARGQIDVTITEGLGGAGTNGSGRLYQRNGVFQRLELTGQSNRQSFSLSFRDDDSTWGGGGGGGWGGGRNVALPSGTTIHRGAIISVGSGKGLDVADASLLDGASVQQWDYARQANQNWQILDLGSGEVAIIATHSNKVLTVQGGRDLNGANVVQREWRNNPYQRWRLEQVGGGVYRIMNVGSGKALDVSDQSRENGANIQQWDYANQQNQQWRLGR